MCKIEKTNKNAAQSGCSVCGASCPCETNPIFRRKSLVLYLAKQWYAVCSGFYWITGLIFSFVFISWKSRIKHNLNCGKSKGDNVLSKHRYTQTDTDVYQFWTVKYSFCRMENVWIILHQFLIRRTLQPC